MLQRRPDSGIVFVLLPAGKYAMGAQSEAPEDANYDPAAKRIEGPVHDVTVSPFFIAKHEITRAQWTALGRGKDPSAIKIGSKNYSYDGSYPVDDVSLRETTRLLSRHCLLVPTEGQWEYACRAGTTTPYGVDAGDLSSYANLADATASQWCDFSCDLTLNDRQALTGPVGSYQPNAFGLHDMLGRTATGATPPRTASSAERRSRRFRRRASSASPFPSTPAFASATT
jgi:formylglycine-generating enzyme required for sulfatase activity